ncbi:TPA: hypothetical protein EYP38_02560 [Candidatus Micrarchaeota archaeon]|nr:hypothetical protein [Candidatus Micrarchaeota archaeon]
MIETEQNLERISGAIDDIRTMIRFEDSDDAKIILLAYLSRLYRTLEEKLEKPDGPELPGLLEEVAENRRRAIEQAHELIHRIDFERDGERII